MNTPPDFLLLLLGVLSASVVVFVILTAAHRGARAVRLLGRAIHAMELRNYDEAIELYDRADELRHKIGNPTAKGSVGFAVEQGLGVCWLEKNQFAEAERHIHHAIELLNQGVEQEHRIVVHLYCNLASTLCGQGKEAEGEAALVKVDELCAATRRPQIEGVAEMLVGSAAGATSRNQYQLAFRLARQAISMVSKTDAWHQGQWAQAQFQLATIHMLVGEYRRARELIEHAVASVGEGQLDEEDHDDTLFYIGELELIAGDCHKAIECLQKCVEIRQQEQGARHLRTSVAIAALAFAFRAYGNYPQAEKLFREALEIQAETLSPDDAILIGTKVQFALVLCDLGKYDEANQLLNDAEALALEVAKAMGNALPAMRLIRGLWHLDQFQYERAITTLNESVALAQKIYGESHVLTADFRQILGKALVCAERFYEAEQLLNETLAIREAAPDASQIDFADLLLIVAELHLATGRANDAEAAARRAEMMVVGKLLPTSLSLARLSTILAEALARQGHGLEAKKSIEQAEAIHGQVQPPDHPRLIRFCNAAALVYQVAGDMSAAMRYRRQADAIRSRFERG